MGVISDLLSAAKTFDAGGTDGLRGPISRPLVRRLQSILDVGDRSYPSGTAVTNEVQSIAAHAEADDGTFTLTFTLYGGQTFTTAAIAYDAVAATIQTAIHTAANLAAVPGWANGHIAATGGPLSSGALTLTFSGASVSGRNHGQTTISGAALEFEEGAGTAGAATTTTHGQTARSAWATLMALGLIATAPPAQGADVTSVTAEIAAGAFPFGLSDDDVKMLIDEACYQDGGLASVRTKLLQAIFGLGVAV